MFERARFVRGSRLASMTGGAFLAVALLGAGRAPADMIQTMDGQWNDGSGKPPAVAADDLPGDDLLAACADTKVDATYETVKNNKGFSKPAGQVRRIVASDRTVEKFGMALRDATGNLFGEAADGFLAVSQELQGCGKQEALWLRVQAYASAGAADKAVAACDDLIAAFPKSFYFADAMILKAKVAAGKGDLDGAGKALASVKAAQGMNSRDLYRAEHARISLTLELQKKFEEAAADYRTLMAMIDKDKDAATAAATRQQALVGLGNCLLATKKDAEARGFFEKATESRDPDVLAGAYAGLGDVALVEAKGLREASKLKEAKDKLEEAVLHYLRVTVKYRTEVDDESPVLRSLENQAKVFRALFEMSGNKDCELANRAYSSYVDLSRMLPDGPMKKQVNRDAIAFDAQREAAGCKK